MLDPRHDHTVRGVAQHAQPIWTSAVERLLGQIKHVQLFRFRFDLFTLYIHIHYIYIYYIYILHIYIYILFTLYIYTPIKGTSLNSWCLPSIDVDGTSALSIFWQVRHLVPDLTEPEVPYDVCIFHISLTMVFKCHYIYTISIYYIIYDFIYIYDIIYTILYFY